MGKCSGKIGPASELKTWSITCQEYHYYQERVVRRGRVVHLVQAEHRGLAVHLVRAAHRGQAERQGQVVPLAPLLVVMIHSLHQA